MFKIYKKKKKHSKHHIQKEGEFVLMETTLLLDLTLTLLIKDEQTNIDGTSKIIEKVIETLHKYN